MSGGWSDDMEMAPKGEPDDWTSRPRLRLWMDGMEVHGRWNDDRFAKRPRPYWMADGRDVSWSRQSPPTHWAEIVGPFAVEVAP